LGTALLINDSAHVKISKPVTWTWEVSVIFASNLGCTMGKREASALGSNTMQRVVAD